MRKLIGLGLLMISPLANALVLPNDAKTMDRVSVYYTDWSSNAETQSMGFAFDTAGVMYSHAAIKDWGEYIGLLDVSNISQKFENDFDDMTTINGKLLVHKNIGDSNFNLWMNNSFAISTVLTSYNVYAGVSYDLNIGKLQIKPAIGYHHAIGMGSLKSDITLPNGQDIALHTDYSGSGGIGAVVTAQYPISVLNQQVIINAAVDAQFARSDEYQKFLMVGSPNGFGAVLNADWIINENFNAYAEYRYTNQYAISLDGQAAGVSVGVGYSF